jgi:regulator of sigma E protease
LGSYLIATELNATVSWLLAALGLGVLIFVHELGHFAVAKWCGVKCEKFYLGFDIFGLSLVKIRWGETEYGIGILPLGGYVKMLGQDDNPARAAEERDRARLATAEPAAGAAPSAPDPAAPEPLDPRSYLAQSVPERMAIISAGVIMNMVLAFAVATLAYGLGVRESACAVSNVLPGEAAWRSDLRPGDRILAINGFAPERPLVYNDLLEAVMVGQLETGVRLRVQRGDQAPFELVVHPDRNRENDRGRPTIGAEAQVTTRLDARQPTIDHTPAAGGKFQPGDKLVAVGEELIRTQPELLALMARRADRALRFTVERPAADSAAATPERVEIEVPARRMLDLGLRMKTGVVTAVQDHSPAAAAGIRPDDFLESIDGASPHELDPLTLPERLRRRAGEVVQLQVQRQPKMGPRESLTLSVTPRDPAWYERPAAVTSPLTIPALGLAFRVLNVVHAVEPGGPADRAVWKQGDQPSQKVGFSEQDVIVKVEFLIDGKLQESDRRMAHLARPIELQDEDGAVQASWPFVMEQLQWVPRGTKVRLTLADQRTAEILPVESQQWYHPDRGFNLAAELVDLQATNLGEALALGWKKTVNSALIVYSFLRALGTGQVSTKNVGGIGTIATVAARSAERGFTDFLMFLVAISANLAVINMLPIPVLDGGHMMFLMWEAVRGRPPSEKVQIRLTWVGALLILTLIVYSNGLDVLRLVNWIIDR